MTSTRKWSCTVLSGAIAFGLALSAPPASAQDRFNLQLFRPTPSQQNGVLNTHGARLLPPLDLEVHLMGSLGWSPFALVTDDGLTEGKVVSSIMAGNLLFAVGLHERVEVGVDLPVLRMQRGDGIPGYREAPLEETVYTLGDIRLVPRFSLYSTFDDRHDEDGIALAAVIDASFPSGDEAAYAGDGGLSIDTRLALDVGFAGGHNLSVNAGYAARPATEIETLEVDDYLGLSVGGRAQVIDNVQVLAELRVALTTASDLGTEEVPVELLGGGRYTLGDLMFQAGAGAGLSTGVGPTDWRVWGSVGWLLEHDRGDRDADGLLNADDACPDEAEDADGFADHDGCPDLDDDEDGVPDVMDSCPYEAEDLDGLADADGCPETDADGDTVADSDDACGDVAEDLDGFADHDGCPDEDNDQDGFADVVDGCPNTAGTAAGCPLTAVSASVYFSTNEVILDDADYWELDRFLTEVAALPVQVQVRIEGHADVEGTPDVNLTLSQSRANAIRDYLIAHGVLVEQIDVAVFGADRPAASNESDEGRALNRRVELRTQLPAPNLEAE